MDKPAVYIDFDKTIAPSHGFSTPPSPEVVAAINLLQTKYKIIIYSTRANPDITTEVDYLQLLEYLSKNGIKYDQICDSKPLYVAIIDDRSFNPLKESWLSIADQLMRPT
jgi:trehalose-6-phosphatase